jgi:hypothetical protein
MSSEYPGSEGPPTERVASTEGPATETATSTEPPPSPAWRPPPPDHGRNASLILGVIIVFVGLWFFAEQTLGLDLPSLDWAELWPMVLIAFGAWIVLGAIRRTR